MPATAPTGIPTAEPTCVTLNGADGSRRQICWTPLASEDDDGTQELLDVEGEELIGKPWTYKLQRYRGHLDNIHDAFTISTTASSSRIQLSPPLLRTGARSLFLI